MYSASCEICSTLLLLADSTDWFRLSIDLCSLRSMAWTIPSIEDAASPKLRPNDCSSSSSNDWKRSSLRPAASRHAATASVLRSVCASSFATSVSAACSRGSTCAAAASSTSILCVVAKDWRVIDSRRAASSSAPARAASSAGASLAWSSTSKDCRMRCSSAASCLSVTLVSMTSISRLRPSDESSTVALSLVKASARAVRSLVIEPVRLCSACTATSAASARITSSSSRLPCGC